MKSLRSLSESLTAILTLSNPFSKKQRCALSDSYRAPGAHPGDRRARVCALIALVFCASHKLPVDSFEPGAGVGAGVRVEREKSRFSDDNVHRVRIDDPFTVGIPGQRY